MAAVNKFWNVCHILSYCLSYCLIKNWNLDLGLCSCSAGHIAPGRTLLFIVRLCFSWFASKVNLRKPLCFLAKEVVKKKKKKCPFSPGTLLAASLSSWWVNQKWELVMCIISPATVFLVCARRDKCLTLIIQVLCLVWIIRLGPWGHVIGCKSKLVNFYLPSIPYLGFVKVVIM